ncbi:hypothetical protein SDC9_158707 [bioreactor metagenome]|uniref:Carboxymuconolactone decarboxylase-like domain-containing protein n=1 Tax=bioreactor metagenome TaxID=1076179 RepID=A0A645FCP3_9ZZZZ|nr:hypothetical protein SPFL3101_01195 [Sporomusaceae bacterium FL31]GCE35037.1 hypothetical protein SPFL3102_02865 [Sporomusaceae bacterium]
MNLNNQTKALISIGASIGANCQPCLQYHVAHAKEIGISEQEIQVAIRVGQMVRKGAASKMDQYVIALQENTSISPQSEGNDCMCGCGD